MKIEGTSLLPEKFDYLFKIVLAGDSGVGKTNLITQLTRKEFSTNTPATIGVEFASISFKIDSDIVKVQIWDTAGQERYRAITSAYYRGAHGALVVYDITRRPTLFQSINHWLIQLRQYSKKDMVMILIGNKKDLEDQRQVTEDELKNKAEQNQLAYFETSALSGENVSEVFYELVKKIYEKNKLLSPKSASKKGNVDLTSRKKELSTFKPKSKKKSCC